MSSALIGSNRRRAQGILEVALFCPDIYWRDKSVEQWLYMPCKRMCDATYIYPTCTKGHAHATRFELYRQCSKSIQCGVTKVYQLVVNCTCVSKHYES